MISYEELSWEILYYCTSINKWKQNMWSQHWCTFFVGQILVSGHGVGGGRGVGRGGGAGGGLGAGMWHQAEPIFWVRSASRTEACKGLNSPFAPLLLHELALWEGDAGHLGLPLLVVAQQNTPPPYYRTLVLWVCCWCSNDWQRHFQHFLRWASRRWSSWWIE